jgi:hypothetical protein
MHDRDTHDTESRALKLELEKSQRTLRLLEDEFSHITRIATKIVRNVRHKFF